MSPRQNYVILLDLSDRLLTPHQVENDLAIIRQTLDQFVLGAKHKFYVGSSDRFKIVLAPQKSSSVDFHAYEELLYLDMGNDTQFPLKQKRFVSQKADQLFVLVKKLYAQASRNKDPKQYQGADLWRYFNESLTYDFPNEGKFTDRNYLVVLTDGYLDFEDYRGKRQSGNRYGSTKFVSTLASQRDKWEDTFRRQDFGILRLKASLSNQLQVLIPEVNPHADYHFEILEATWQKWLGEAKVHRLQVLQKGNFATTRQQLIQFLNL